MANWKTMLCILGALGGLLIASTLASEDVPCKHILEPGGIPIDQCLGDYVCHNGTCSERSDKLTSCLLPKTRSAQTRCPVPGLEFSQDDLADLVTAVVSSLNGSLCSGQYWDFSFHVTSQLDTGGKCSQRFHQEIAGCTELFLQKFITGNASADALCREYERSRQCITELTGTECCFNQTEEATLVMIMAGNPFCQCANVTSSVVATATERPNKMAATVPFSQRGPACSNVPQSTGRPTSSSSRLHLFVPLMVFNFALNVVRWTNCS